MSLLVAIPAFNEEKSIKQVISEIQTELPNSQILVIDDGSRDRTSSYAREMGAIVITLPINLGVGGAIRVAYKYAERNKFRQVLQIDADGQHIPSEIKKLIEVATENSIVIGSRFLTHESNYSVSRTRRMAMRILAFTTGIICKEKLTDVTSGFRLSTGSPVKLFAIEYPRDYLADTIESLIIASKAGIKISEISVKMNNRTVGVPSQNTLQSIWYLIRILLVIVLAKLKKN